MSPLTSQPNFATIMLPPGLTLDQFEDLQGKCVTIAITLACALSLAVWDFFNLLPTELVLYRHVEKRTWKQPGLWAFIVLRYSILVAMISGIFLTSTQSQHCQAAASVGQVGVVLVVGSAGIIFSYRVFSIWSFNKMVCYPVTILYLATIACWTAVATQLRAEEGSPTPFASNCLLHSVPVWSPLGMASSVAFDSFVLALTIAGLGRAQTKSPLSRQILKDNILYFVIVTITNIVVLVIQCLDEEYEFIKPLALPFPTLMTTAMGCRIYLNLRLFEHQRPSQAGPVSFPFTSGTALHFASNPVLSCEHSEDQKHLPTHAHADPRAEVSSTDDSNKPV